jgi:Ca2+-binding RTX toxin-like protein
VGDVGGKSGQVAAGNYNVCLILDYSTSMDDQVPGTSPSVSRLQMLQAAVENLLTAYANHPGTVNVKIVVFGTNIIGQWTGSGDFSLSQLSNGQTAINWINSVDDNRGTQYTNYEAAMQAARTWFDSVNVNGYNNKAYFLSDGDPTAKLNNSGGVDTNLNPDASYINEAITAAGTMLAVGGTYSVDMQAIGIGSGVTEANLDKFDNSGDTVTPGDAQIVNSPSELSQALDVGQTPTPFTMGADIVNGGDGDDLLLGDAPYTESINDSNANTIGWQNFGGMSQNDVKTWLLNNVDLLKGEYAGVTYGNDTLNAGAGNDIVVAHGGNDDITGGTGNDRLIGGSGNDTYRFAAGDGTDTIEESKGAKDTVIITGGALPVLSQVGNNLIIAYGSGDVITVKDHFLNNVDATNNQRVEFVSWNGTVYTVVGTTLVQPTLSVADVAVTEGGTANVIVSLSAVAATDVTVKLYTTTGSAGSGDFDPTHNGVGNAITVTIPQGSTSVVVPITTTQDSTVEGNETFTVTLTTPTGATVNDGSAVVTINNDDVAAAPVITYNSGNNAAIGFAENATGTVATITATDANGDTLSYSLSGPDAAKFSITSGGVLSLTTPLDFEGTSSASVTVTVSDGSLTDTQTITVNATNVNEMPTAVNDANAGTNTVGENAANGTLVGVTASGVDPDAGTTFIYSLVDNAGGRFTINSSTGVVSVANGTLLNYESATSHNITVRASDGTLFKDQVFTIQVSNVNEAPVITDNNGSGNSVSETAAIGTAVGVTVLGTDPEGNAPVTYSLLDDAGGRFAINSTTGVVTVMSGLDREYATSHDIVVQATDSLGAASTATFTIAVNNVSGGGDTTDTYSVNLGTDNTFNDTDGGLDRFVINTSGEAFSIFGFENLGGDNLTIHVNNSDVTLTDHFLSGETIEYLNFNGGGSYLGYDLGTGTYTLNNDQSGSLDGGAGNDIIASGAGLGQTLNGADGNDLLFGNDGVDTLNGGNGNDLLIGGAGADILHGDAGKDTLVYDSADTVIDGGADTDRLALTGTVAVDSAFVGKMTGIEVIDMTNGVTTDQLGTGNGTSANRLSAQDVLDITDTAGGNLYIAGDVGDTVRLNSNEGWSSAGNVNVVNSSAGDNIPDGTYVHYVSSGGTHLYVDQDVTVITSA